MKFAVCDDEKIFTDIICRELEKYYNKNVQCICFSDGSEIISAFRNHENFDAVFLDIEMKSTDGMTAAREIRKYSPDVPIIFLTSHTELAPEGYEVNAFRFLKKPVSKEKLYSALSDMEKLYGKRKTIILKDGGNEYPVSPDEIIYAQSSNNDVRFITANREFKVRMKFSKALEMLSENSSDFLQIHRCIAVNLRHVSNYSPTELQTANGEKLPVSRKFSEPLRLGMYRFIKSNARQVID